MSRPRALASLAVLSVLLLTPVLVGAATISTLYDSNNYGNLGGAVYFDLATGANALTITGFETNASGDDSDDLVDPFGFEVFTLLDTSFGNELSSSWSSAATGTGIVSGPNNPSLITLNNFFTLDANTTYGIALVNGGSCPPPLHERDRGRQPILLQRRPEPAVGVGEQLSLRRQCLPPARMERKHHLRCVRRRPHTRANIVGSFRSRLSRRRLESAEEASRSQLTSPLFKLVPRTTEPPMAHVQVLSSTPTSSRSNMYSWWL